MLAKIRWRPSTFVFGAFVLSTLILGLIISPYRPSSSFQAPWATDTADIHLGDEKPKPPPIKRGYHLMMPTTKSGLNFCKSLLTMVILGYPTPQIIGWGDEDGRKGLKGGGSHYAKIARGLEYVMDEKRRQNPTFDDDLIIILDSYDIWFQLPWETLVARYDAAVAEENERLAHRMGRAASIENITSTIIFAGGKRCCPNQRQSVACYPIPDSPLPADLHAGATDTVMGRDPWSSFRTRYLVGGYVIGPVGKMRPLLQRAQAKLDECMSRQGAWYDGVRDGAEGTVNFCYRGSDQSIWAEILGEQEFHREVMRRRHRKHIDDVLDAIIPNRAGSKPPPTNVMGAVVNDLLNPSFPHQEWDPGYLPDKPYEYGVTIDYWSLLGHQTIHSGPDTRYIRNNISFEQQVGPLHMFDCKPKQPNIETLLHEGLLDLVPGADWRTLPMYTEICLGVVPAMIHHNNVDKSQLAKQWNKVWWFGHARRLFEMRVDERLPMLVDGIPTDKGDILMWDDVCPSEFDRRLFRDVEEGEAEEGMEEEAEFDGAYKNTNSNDLKKPQDEGKKKEDAKKEDAKKEDGKKEDAKKEDTNKGDDKKEDANKEDVNKGDDKQEDANKKHDEHKGENGKDKGESHTNESPVNTQKEEPSKEEPAIDESHHDGEDSKKDQPPAEDSSQNETHHDENAPKDKNTGGDSHQADDLQQDEHALENTHHEQENAQEKKPSPGESQDESHHEEQGVQENQSSVDSSHPDGENHEGDHTADGAPPNGGAQKNEHASEDSHHDEGSQQDEHAEINGKPEEAPEDSPGQDSQSDSHSGNP
ncbi:hypothetical protein AK830_g1173 [Neonectria ditissima]|uniref:Uncharacterized protein n=1 Tax=Neonectria ditissima TaxID=78410 RepID=A0A0P7B6H8_9HYPO|nr:hypothetical protein AK830_g1173 [Neonectria ditissima]